jgi:haloalkane dehalogenase
MSDAIPESAAAESRMVSVPGGRLHVTDFPGAEPALVVLHGFPDDSRIYDRLAPLLAPRRVAAVDWLGYGRSDRAGPGPFGGARHQRELRAVLDSLELDRVGLAGHDASGPDAIDFALGEPGRVGHLILLNTYYGHPPAGRFPEMIRLLADPELTPLADAMMDDPNQRLWLLNHTGRRWGLDAGDQQGIAFASILPQFFGDDSQPDALAAVRAWTSALFPALDQQDARIAAGDLAGRPAGHADFRRGRRLPQPRPRAPPGRAVPARGSAPGRRCLPLAAVGPARNRRPADQPSRAIMSRAAAVPAGRPRCRHRAPRTRRSPASPSCSSRSPFPRRRPCN